MKRLSLLVVMMAGLSGGAEAQTRPPVRPVTRPRPVITERVFIGVNGVFQANSNDLQDSKTIRVNAENGRFDTAYAVGSGPAVDVSGGVILTRSLAVGVGLTRFSTNTPTTMTASVPHPFFFNQPRSVTGEVTGNRQEMAVHIQVRGVFPVNNRVMVTVFGGPSFFTVEQDVVNDFDYTESYPFDTATFSRAISSSQSESKVGVNLGGDVAYFFSRQVGVGVSVMYSGATVEMTLPSGTSDVKAGGGQIGGGLRLRF